MGRAPNQERAPIAGLLALKSSVDANFDRHDDTWTPLSRRSAQAIPTVPMGIKISCLQPAILTWLNSGEPLGRKINSVRCLTRRKFTGWLGPNWSFRFKVQCMLRRQCHRDLDAHHRGVRSLSKLLRRHYQRHRHRSMVNKLRFRARS